MAHPQPISLDEPRSALEIVCGRGVLEGFGYLSMILVPGGSMCMQGCQALLPNSALETGTQHLGEEMVVAIPATLVVQRYQEQIGCVQGLQHLLAIVPAVRLCEAKSHSVA